MKWAAGTCVMTQSTDYLSIHTFVHYFYLSIHYSFITSIYPSIIYFYIHPSLYLSIHLSIPSLYLSIHLSILHSSITLSIHPFIYSITLSIHLFMYTCTYIYSLFSSLTVSHTGVISLAWILYTHSCKVQKQLKDTRETHIKNYRHRLLHLGEKWNDIKQRHRVVVHIPSKGMYLIFKGNSCSPCLSLEKCS